MPVQNNGKQNNLTTQLSPRPSRSQQLTKSFFAIHWRQDTPSGLQTTLFHRHTPSNSVEINQIVFSGHPKWTQLKACSDKFVQGVDYRARRMTHKKLTEMRLCRSSLSSLSSSGFLAHNHAPDGAAEAIGLSSMVITPETLLPDTLFCVASVT
jgi:hypothetical protein